MSQVIVVLIDQHFASHAESLKNIAFMQSRTFQMADSYSSYDSSATEWKVTGWKQSCKDQKHMPDLWP